MPRPPPPRRCSAARHALHPAAAGLLRCGAGSLQLPLSGVPPRLQKLDLMSDLQADRYVAPAVPAFWTPLAVRKSP